MARRIYACTVDEISRDRPAMVSHGRQKIGVFELADGYAALLNVCPHRGGQLCEGPVCGTTRETEEREFVYDRAGELVRCAWHGWEFEIATGRCLVDERLRARSFPVMRDGDRLYIEIG